MASGKVNRIKRPNTWLQRPKLQNREGSSCQTGAVHTWHKAALEERIVRQYCCSASLSLSLISADPNVEFLPTVRMTGIAIRWRDSTMGLDVVRR